MNYNLLARVAKLVALLGFFLPWVTVSCSGNQLAEATGWQLMTGDVQMSGPAADQFNKPEPAVLIIVVFAIIALGLLVGLLTKGRAAATAMIVSSIAAIALSFVAFENMRESLRNEITEAQAEPPTLGGTQIFSADQMSEMSRSMANSIAVEKRDGFWVTVGALGAAALCCLLALARGPARSAAQAREAGAPRAPEAE